VKRFQRQKGYAIYKFRMLEVRENETLLRKLSGGNAQLRTLEGTLVMYKHKTHNRPNYRRGVTVCDNERGS